MRTPFPPPPECTEPGGMRAYHFGPCYALQCACFCSFTMWPGRVRPMSRAVRKWGPDPPAGVLATDPLECARCGGRWFYALARCCSLWQYQLESDFSPETTGPTAIAGRGIEQPAPTSHVPPGSPPDPSSTRARLWEVHRRWQPTKPHPGTAPADHLHLARPKPRSSRLAPSAPGPGQASLV